MTLEDFHRIDAENTRDRVEALMALRPCAECHGARLRPEVLAVTVGGPRMSSSGGSANALGCTAWTTSATVGVTSGSPANSRTAAWTDGLVREYASLAEVATDFAVTTSGEYLAAQAMFSQKPKPAKIKIGMFGGICLGFPAIAAQLWIFVAPGLYKHEKGAFLPFLLEPVALDQNAFQADGLHPTAAAQPKLLDHVWKALKPLLA